MKLPQPKNEKRRLEVLWQYDVLDTPAESAFDDLTELAADICGAPVATITFIDEKRQWFKSKIGLSASETSRDISFCAHAILGSELLIVPDATKDKRFAKNPLVTGEPHIRFYAGAPLINPEGHALGTLCVIDKVPRELNPTQQHALQVLSRHVVALLEFRRHSVDKVKHSSERKQIEDRNAALSKLGQNLSAARSPKDAARVIGETTRELFGWDMFTLDLYFAGDDTVHPILNIDTIDDKLTECSSSIPIGPPSPLARRIIRDGANLILKQPPLTMLVGASPFGDTTRPSASLMLVPIRNGTEVIGVLSNQSYTLDAYTEQELSALQTIADHCGGALGRIRAEEALRTSEVRFHSVWENSVDGMRLTDENGIIVAVNKAFCQLVEMERAELEGKPFTATYATPANPTELLNTYKRRFHDRTVEKFIERKMIFRSGKTVELEGANSFVDLESKRPLLFGLFRDVTEQKRLETQLRQSQKMDSIGQLAGGIAHDFNNLLTVIQGHTSLLLATETKGEASESLQEIALAAERSANLTRQLLTFSRRQVMQRKTLDLKEVVDEMTRMLRRILGEDIVLKVVTTSDLPRIHADRGMMEQILLNLAVNARDAMPRGGELTLCTSATQIDETYTRQNCDAYLGEFVCLKVSDTGCGITPENMGHIFEPFFTTKEIGKGTGLGLATVYGIVKQHDGWIEANSEVGQGTAFTICFPRSLEPLEASGKLARKKIPRGTETILVVEDETPLRELVQFILERQGYHVLEAASGVAALKVWEQHKGSIDLVLTDLVMPEGMTGRDLATRLQTESPQLKIVFTSGYSADIVGKDFVLRDGLNFLQKPYHPDKLAQTVRDCLDG
ncbi:MAG: GAF domain-containing protein, partial [Verrucomicrobiota bacterium]